MTYLCTRCGQPAKQDHTRDDPLSYVNCKAAARQRICGACGHKKGLHRGPGKGCFGDLPTEVWQWRTAPGPCACPAFVPKEIVKDG